MEREEEARSIARDAVCRPRTPVRDRPESRQRPVEELARRAPARVGDEADTAGVALSGRLVEWGGHSG